MKIYDILSEASDDSGDYQQMLAFTRANRVGGVPDDQQIPLALFKELKKQQQQNQALGAELDAAEQRIDQATQSGELSQKELGMHRTELDRERAAGDQQKAAVTQLGQQYSERERASGEQIQQLASQLQQVKTMPGVDANAAKELEKKIKELGERSVSVDRLAELESSIAQIQNSSIADDSAIKDLLAQVNDAQKATKELEKTKQTVGRDAEETAKRALDQIEQIKQQLAHFRKVEQAVVELQPKVNNELAPKVDELVKARDFENQIKTIKAAKAFKAAETSAQLRQTTAANAQDAMTMPYPAQSITPTVPRPAVAESAFARSVAWATGKKL